MKIETLAADIFSLFNSNVETVSLGVSHDADRGELNELYMSNLGKPLRQLYYELTSAPNKEALSGKTKFKFVYGHILEDLVLELAERAGHEVRDRQRRVEVDGVRGKIDAIIDGVLVDAKSCSPRAFSKFVTGSILDDDPFGYIYQLSGYWAAIPECSRAGFLAINKVDGELFFYELPGDRRRTLQDVKDRISLVRSTVGGGTEPPKCYDPVPEGKSGNLRLGVGCSYCVAPDTKILKSDLSWSEAGSISDEDKLLGFTFPGAIKAKVAEVIGTTRLILPSVRVTTEQGSITVSSDHLFLCRTVNGHLLSWKKAGELKPGQHKIRFLSSPWEEDLSREGGYLAGFLDGEGCFSGRRLSWAQRPGKVADYVLKLMDERGFDQRVRYVKPNSDCLMWAVKGRRFDSYRALGIIRPKRLLKKAIDSLDGMSLKSKIDNDPLVLRVDNAGQKEVVAIETSTGTLITDGYFSHNCPHKFHCWRDANNGRGPVAYYYSSGPKYLVHVAKEPKVQSTPAVDTDLMIDTFPTKDKG